MKVQHSSHDPLLEYKHNKVTCSHDPLNHVGNYNDIKQF